MLFSLLITVIKNGIFRNIVSISCSLFLLISTNFEKIAEIFSMLSFRFEKSFSNLDITLANLPSSKITKYGVR